MTDRSSYITQLPDDVTIEKKTKTITLIVDSRDRDMRKYPDPSKYTLVLREDLNDVLSIKLANATLPRQPIIHSGNNCFYVSHTPDTGPTAYKIENVPYYEWNDIDKIIEKVSRKLSLLTGQEVILRYNTEENSFSISSDLSNGGFHLSWSDGEVAFMEPDIERVILRNEDGTEYRDRDGQLVFTEVDISPKRDKALDYSIGDILGFHPATQIPYWWGKIRYRVESESWVALPDSDNFKISKPTLVEGQWIIINPNYRTRINKIVSRHDDNSYSVLLEDISGISLNTDYLFHSGYNVSNIPPIKNSAMYTVLSIPSIYRNRSNNKNIHKSFALIPNIPCNSMSSIIRVESSNSESYYKKFSHPRPRISELSFCFQNSDGSLVDFMGQEHYMVFHIEVSGQSLKYV